MATGRRERSGATPSSEGLEGGPICAIKIEITQEMIRAGESIILGELGGLDLPGFLSAREMATQVYQAMRRLAQANP